MKYLFGLFLIIFTSCSAQKTAQNSLVELSKKYNQKVLRGSNTEFRNWWNVLHYNLNVTPEYQQKFISGSIDVTFEVIKESQEKVMQVDLQKPMQITKIVYSEDKNTTELNPESWLRNGNAYFIDLKEIPLKKENIIRIYFEGKPRIARNAPWDGGWIFTKDAQKRPWMSVAVQGLGASAWYPNKDFQGDEPDKGVSFTLNVSSELTAVAGGKLSSVKALKDNKRSYTWEVKNTINNYCIIPYIGHYENFSDTFQGKDGVLKLSYWVLDYNVKKAKKQFEQVKPMLMAFEDWMGAYPFYEDDYKLVESPYLGMEHQSAIAYGNHFRNGYLGRDLSGSGWGDKFDFIIVHETGHEWFGNNITTEDIADMWVHESFTTYTEAMYLESQFGKRAANEYVQGIRQNIVNDRNIIGEYGINKEGSSDMYYKGANMLHTLRQLMEEDKKFKQMMRDINTEFRHTIVTGKQIEDYLSHYSGIDLNQFFNQYLRTTKIPTLETKKEKGKTYFRWANIIEGFDMPIKLKSTNEWIYPTAEWKLYKGKNKVVADENFYIYQ